MLHALLENFDWHRGTELENLDVFRPHHRFERGEIHRAAAGRAMIARMRLHVVDVKSSEPVRISLEMLRVLDET